MTALPNNERKDRALLNFLRASELHAAPRTARDKRCIVQGLTPAFDKIYTLTRTIGSLAVVATSGFIGGSRGAALAATLELTNHARRHGPMVHTTLNTARAQLIDRHWSAIKDSGILPRSRAAFPTKPIIQRPQPLPLSSLPTGVKIDFIYTAMTLGLNHTGIMQAWNRTQALPRSLARRIIGGLRHRLG